MGINRPEINHFGAKVSKGEGIKVSVCINRLEINHSGAKVSKGEGIKYQWVSIDQR